MPTEQTDLEYLFSKERLESYNNIYEHFDNLKMIASTTTKIAILELVLRNLLDKHMKEKDLEWLRNYNEENIKQKIIKLQNKEILDNNQLISRISLVYN
ncbi:TPA: CAAX protease [Campylobacter jejuni]|nr:CAAX protease [Campylobacter jejuni]